MTFTRRSFLKLATAGVAGAVLRPLPALAQSPGPRKLVIALAYGGWDTTWVMDPKPDSSEVDRIPGDIQYFGELPIWTNVSRPSVTRFFEQWSGQTAIINGVAVESLAHEPCADVVLTGALGGERADVGARVAAHLGDARPLPYLALGAQAETHELEAVAARLGDTNQIMALATPGFGWPAPGQNSADLGLALNETERALIGEHLRRSASQMEQAPKSLRTARLLNDYRASLSRMEGIEASARTGGMLADYELFQDVSGPWRHVAAALAEGLSQTALIQPSLFWDTHAYNAGQGQAYEDFFGGLNTLMSELSRLQLLEETAVLVLSEMGRTPRHNSQGGKDHWPWTSAMLVSTHIKGGRVIGATNEWLRPSPIDLGTGQPIATGVPIHAEHVLATTAKLLGVEESWFERDAIDALLD